MRQVSEHVWAEVDYDGANVGCVVGERGVVMVEAPMCPSDARDWLARVRGVTDRPIRFIVTTDHHFDHAVCSSILCPDLIMHEEAAAAFEHEVKGYVEDLFLTYYAARFEEVRGDIARLEIVSPLIVFSHLMVIDLGDVRIELTHVGGHAKGTSLVYVVEDGVLFAGDNVTHGRHAYMGEMSLDAWLEALHTAAGLEPKLVVPGHGDVGDADTIHTMTRFFTRMKKHVERGIELGLTEDQVAADHADLVAFFPIPPGREAMTPEWVEEGLRRSYRELA